LHWAATVCFALLLDCCAEPATSHVAHPHTAAAFLLSIALKSCCACEPSSLTSPPGSIQSISAHVQRHSVLFSVSVARVPARLMLESGLTLDMHCHQALQVPTFDTKQITIREDHSLLMAISIAALQLQT
jgi:hypothetical protein